MNARKRRRRPTWWAFWIKTGSAQIYPGVMSPKASSSLSKDLKKTASTLCSDPPLAFGESASSVDTLQPPLGVSAVVHGEFYDFSTKDV